MVGSSEVAATFGVSRLRRVFGVRLCGLCCAVAVLLVGTSALAQLTLEVPSTDYPTIQSAINAALDPPGHTVIGVAAGTYYENLGWRDKSIELIGAGAGLTIVDANVDHDEYPGPGRCLVMAWVPDTAVVNGFTFRNGAPPAGQQRAGGVFLYISSPTLIDNIITGNEADLGAGVGIDIGCAPTFIGNVITDNHAGSWGGGLYVFTSAPTFINNTISDNSAVRGGGLSLWKTSATLTGNTITDNWAGLGGGVYIQWIEKPGDPSPTLTNNLIARNVATSHGGGVWIHRSSPILTNNTIVDNEGGGFYHSQFDPQNPVITNCILFGNTVYDVVGEPCTVTYCDIGEGPWWVWIDPTNISADPMFVGGGDYHLDDGSPCIDAGDNAAPELPLTDKDGNARIVADYVDLGAYEWQGPSVITVQIDIKPGSYPNAINNDGRGVIPVAVLGSADFEVSLILVDTVTLQGMSIKVVGKASKMLYHYEDVNGDGFDDLVLQIQDMDGAFQPGTVTATLSGELLCGTPIVGQDDITIVPPQ